MAATFGVHVNLTKRIEAMLLDSLKPVGVGEMVDQFKVERKTVLAAALRLREKYGDKLLKTTKEKDTAYRLTDVEAARAIRKSVKASTFPLPADLWRGWRNPATGYRPAKLGL